MPLGVQPAPDTLMSAGARRQFGKYRHISHVYPYVTTRFFLSQKQITKREK